MTDRCPSHLRAAMRRRRCVRARSSTGCDATTIGRVGERPSGFEPCGYEAETSPPRSSEYASTRSPLPELFARSADGSRGRGCRRSPHAGRPSFLDGVDDGRPGLPRQEPPDERRPAIPDRGGRSGRVSRPGAGPRPSPSSVVPHAHPMAMLTEDHTPGIVRGRRVRQHHRSSSSRGSGDRPPSWRISWTSTSDESDEHRRRVALRAGAVRDGRSGGHAHVATIHSNRRKPLLSEFPLEAGSCHDRPIQPIARPTPTPHRRR